MSVSAACSAVEVEEEAVVDQDVQSEPYCVDLAHNPAKTLSSPHNLCTNCRPSIPIGSRMPIFDSNLASLYIILPMKHEAT